VLIKVLIWWDVSTLEKPRESFQGAQDAHLEMSTLESQRERSRSPPLHDFTPHRHLGAGRALPDAAQTGKPRRALGIQPQEILVLDNRSRLEFCIHLPAFLICQGIAMHRRFERPGLCSFRNLAVSVRGSLALAILLGVWRIASADGKPVPGSPTPGAKAEQPAFDPGVLVGQVVSAEGKPVAGVKVLLRGRTQRGVQTDAAGRFRFEYVQPGHLSIQATKGPLISPRVEFDGVRVPGFKTGKFAPITLTVSEGKVIKVVVTSAATGKPLEGVKLRFWFLKWREQKTEKDGTATFGGLMPGDYPVSAGLPGYAGAARNVEVRAASTVTSVQIALGPGGVVRGTVTDLDGHAVGGAQVSCSENGNYRVFEGGSDKTNGHGAFRCESVPLNTSLQVSVNKDNYLPFQQTVALSPDRRDIEIAIKVRPRPRGGSIEGFARDEKARPIAGATVENHGNRSDQRRKTTTDRTGHYVLDDLYESWSGYDVVIRAPGRAPTSENVKPGTQEKPAHFDFTLEPGHFLHGRIVGENGKPIVGASVSLTQDFWQMVDSKQSDEEGRFEMDSLPASAHFQISKQGYSNLWNVPLRLDGAGATTVVLQPMGVIRGRVVDLQSKKPLDHFQLWLNFARVRQGTVQWTMNGNYSYPGKQIDSKDGTFAINDLMSGLPAEVGVAAEGHSRVILPLVIAKPADEMKPVEVALARLDSSKLAIVSGRILDHSGRGVPGANLRLIVSAIRYGENDYRFNWWQIKNNQLGGSTDCDQFLQAVSDSEGRFEFKTVLPGKHWQLAYWGVHVPEGQKRGTIATQPSKAETVTVTLPMLARMVITIDRVKYAEAAQLNAQTKGIWSQSGQVPINAGQTKFEIEDLAPGIYNVSIQGKPKPVKTPQGTYYTTSSLGNQTILLKAGETKSVQF
jgi:protocatechuate 3,4-dioxygenase beta subunit